MSFFIFPIPLYKSLRLSAVLCCFTLTQGISANEHWAYDHDEPYLYEQQVNEEEFVQEEYSDAEECCPSKAVPCRAKRRSKVPHPYQVYVRGLAPQKYLVPVRRYETVRTEFVDECGCKRTCYHKVPHYYSEERCRLVPDNCCATVWKYESECYNVNDSQINSRNSCEETCDYCPVMSTKSIYEGSFDLNFGYRRDKLNCVLDHFDPPGVFLVDDNLKINKIQIMEIGIKGKCIAKERFMIKGFANIGSVVKGNYVETATTNTGLTSTINLKVFGGDTVDYSIGAGYLYPLFNCLRIGPTGGWSYNTQYLKMKGGSIDALRGLQYSNRWQGAWVGADALLDFCAFGVHAGYEYHFPHWHAEWLLKGSDSPGTYSDVRHSNNGYGNVAFLEAFLNGPGCFEFNCQFKYQYWKMRDGRAHPKFSNIADVGFGPDEVIKVSRSTWESLEVTAGLGFGF